MESDDLLKKQNKRVNIMKSALEKWQKSVLDSWSGQDYSKNIKKIKKYLFHKQLIINRTKKE